MSTTLYGISNCDTVKKARLWLEAHAIDYHFHDFRKDGLTVTQVKKWLDVLGADTLINRRGTTFRQLGDHQKQQLENDPIALLCEYPALIKRPVLSTGKQLTVGFKPELYQSLFTQHTL